MKPSLSSLIPILLAVLPLASAERELSSSSLQSCQTDSKFTATLFDVAFTPSNGTLQWNINGVSSITGKVIIQVNVLAYGLNIYTTTIDPCEAGSGLAGMCPMTEGPLDMDSNAAIPSSALSQVPGMPARASQVV